MSENTEISQKAIVNAVDSLIDAVGGASKDEIGRVWCELITTPRSSRFERALAHYLADSILEATLEAHCE